MDRLDYWVIAFVSMVILVVAGLSYDAYGYDYYYHNYGIWNDTPLICFDDVPPEKKWYILRAGDEWEKSFQIHTGGNNFDYRMAIDSTKFDCDIIVSGYPLNRPMGFSGRAVGTAACSDRDGIFVACIIKIKYEHEWYYTTLEHEIGHTLGLGHHNSFNSTDFIGVVLQKDIMLGQSNPFVSIQTQTLDALIYFHGEEGFNNDRLTYKAKNYTVPHGDEVQIGRRH